MDETLADRDRAKLPLANEASLSMLMVVFVDEDTLLDRDRMRLVVEKLNSCGSVSARVDRTGMYVESPVSDLASLEREASRMRCNSSRSRAIRCNSSSSVEGARLAAARARSRRTNSGVMGTVMRG